MQEHNDLPQADSSETGSTLIRRMDFTDILEAMFSVYRRHIHLFLAITAIYLVLEFSIGIISVFLLETDAMSSTSATVMILIFTALCSFAVSALIVAALTYASTQIYLGSEVTRDAALQQAWQRFWAYIGSAILWSLVVGGLMITIIGIPFAIYFSVRWGLYALPVMFEGSTARNALRRSTKLVRGTWWRVFGIMMAISLISFMIYFILEVSSDFLLTWLRVAEPEEATGLFETIRQLFVPTPSEIGWSAYTMRRLVGLSIAALTMPISTIGSTLLYFDLRIRKEIPDIQM